MKQKVCLWIQFQNEVEIMSKNSIHNSRVLFSLGKIEAYMHRNVKVYLKLIQQCCLILTLGNTVLDLRL